jgi:tellurite resistance protein TerC
MVPMEGAPLYAWAGFIVFIGAMMALDLGVFHRRAHVVRFREAALSSAAWVALALLFCAGLWRFYPVGNPHVRALEFLTAYLVELSLSVDNLFVFLVIFRYFRLPETNYHRVLFWGIVGAVILRAAMILGGVALVARFHWVLYVFGAFLVYTAVKLVVMKEEGVEPGANPLVRMVRKVFRVTGEYSGAAFITRDHAGRVTLTPMLLILLAVETTDVVFALDSIPAGFGVTRDGFILFTANMFAVMGLRSMFFLLSGMLSRFRFLKPGLAAALGFIGVKMVVEPWVEVHIGVSLGVVLSILAASVAVSVLLPAGKRE